MYLKGRKEGSSLQKHSFVRYYLEYLLCFTVLFGVICYFSFLPFIEAKKTLIWTTDAMPQYYQWLEYTATYFRQLIKNFLHGDFTVPMYDFTIGMGSDVRTFLKFEPITLISVFLYGKVNLSTIYTTLTISRLYLAGLSLSCYGFYMKKYGRFAILCGSLAYVFTSYTFYQVEHHPQFAFALIMLPLLLIGLEQVLHRKNGLLFTAIVALTLMGSYYFLYMHTIMMGIYVLLRFGSIYKENRAKEFFQLVFRIIRSYLLGIGISAIFFAPSIASFFQSSRSGLSSSSVEKAVDLWNYDEGRFYEVLLSIAAPIKTTSYLTTVSMTAFCIPALVFLFVRNVREKLSLKIAFLLGGLFLLVPLFGYIFGGFSNVNNRWCFGFIFVLSLVLMAEINTFRCPTWAQVISYAVVVLAYKFIWQFSMDSGLTDLWTWNEFNEEAVTIAINFLLILLAVIVLLKLLPKIPRRVWTAALGIFLCISLAYNGNYINHPDKQGMVNSFQRVETADHFYEDSRFRYLGSIEDDSFYRCDSNLMHSNYTNSSVALEYPGLSLFNSTINSGIIGYLLDTENIGLYSVNNVRSFDGRTASEALACTKYFLTEKTDGDAYIPYGYELEPSLTEKSKTYDIYVNRNLLSVGYSYSKIIRQSDYDLLSPLEKQQVQLQAAVVSDELADTMFASLEQQQEYNGDIQEAEVTFLGTDGELTNDGYSFTNNKQAGDDTISKAHFRTVASTNGEVYVRLVGVETSLISTRADIHVATDRVNKFAAHRAEKDNYNTNAENYLLNLGYYEEGDVIDFSLWLNYDCSYSFDDIECYCVSMDSYESEIEALSEASLEDVVLDDNTVTGTVTTDRDRLMSFSIPYSVGWTATVDGEEVDLVRVNTLYMGLALSEGTHTIELTYQSPGTGIGWIITAISVLLFLVLLVRWIMKRKNR